VSSFDVVVPTVGRPSLVALLDALACSAGPLPGRIIVVHDGGGDPLPGEPPEPLRALVDVRRGRERGPAAARNVGWRSSRADWIAFLDDDVVPDRDWPQRLAADLDGLDDGVAGSQGNLRVPLPAGRRPTDWERNVKGLERAAWATADMAYRRTALAGVGGFDERFPRAYREDADLALRVRRAGCRLVRGRRTVTHPVRPAGWLASVRAQAGNADDALMDALHGRGWQVEARVPRGRRPAHVATTAAACVALAGLAGRERDLAAISAGAWLGATLRLAWDRITPGPLTADEVARMLATSVLLPPAATFHWLAGRARAKRLARSRLPAAVLLDRDGTLVRDVPYNGDPGRVAPMPGARRALDRLRAAGIPLAVVSNQSGIARGLVTNEQVEAVNRRVEELLGPIGRWHVCTHAPDERCACRKPAPGLVVEAARGLGVEPERCVLVGDIGADVEAALAAGARAILVPNGKTRPEEVAAAPLLAPASTAQST
jgi:histidinol-phosphate phosphatase family protein